MGKINKFANIYDTNGNLIRHVGDDGKLKKYTIQELEDLLDKLAEDKDENGNVKDPKALNNVNSILFQEYQKHGNPHEKELLEKLQKIQEEKQSGETTMVEKTSENDITNALQDVESTEYKTSFTPDEYSWDVVPKEGAFYAGEPTKKMFEDVEITEPIEEDEKAEVTNITDTEDFHAEKLVDRETNYEPDQYVDFEMVA